MEKRKRQVFLAQFIAVLVFSWSLPAHADITASQALAYANSFRMKTTSESAHTDASAQGFKKRSSKNLEDVRVISYAGPAEIKLVFSDKDVLTAVFVCIQKYNDEQGSSALQQGLSASLAALRNSLGEPTRTWAAWSDFLAGANFETSVYAEWPYFLLTHDSARIWLERSWAK